MLPLRLVILLGAALEPERSLPDPSFALPEPAAGSMRKFLLIILAIVAVGAGVASLVRTARLKKIRSARERRKLEIYLGRKGLSAQERALLDALVAASGEPADRVAKLVLSFDRSVDAYLARARWVTEESRLLSLRRLKALRARLELHRVAAGVPILSTREIEPGQEVILRSAAAPADAVRTARIIDVDDGGLLVEVLPASAAIDGPLDVYFQRLNDSSYRFRSAMLSNASDPTPGGHRSIWLLAHPRKLAREQRRSLLRMPLHEVVPFVTAPTPAVEGAHGTGSAAPDADARGSLTVVDLSAGGFRAIRPAAEIRLDAVISLTFPFLEPPFDAAPALARAIRLPGGGDEIVFAFDDLPPPVEAAIERHVQKLHQELRTAVTC